jgi:hypothetical protein
MRRRPDQGAEPPEPLPADKAQGKDRQRVWEKSWPSTLTPGTPQWWQEREDQPGDLLQDSDKR